MVNDLKVGFRAVFFVITTMISQSFDTGFAALPKIRCQIGAPSGSFYYAATGKPFYPEGSVFQQVDTTWVQIQFGEGVYNAAAAESALSSMQSWGYNVVRVWLNYPVAGPTSRNELTLYPPYTNNLIDFLKRATNHHVYVILANTFFPTNMYYMKIFNNGQLQNVTGWNSYFYTPGGRDATRTYLRELATEIKSIDGGDLTNTILSFEVWNEICSSTADQPFNLSSGVVQTADGSFDMGDAGSRQHCHDIGLSQFIITCAQAIHQIIPDALCSASVFTNYAVGHAGFNGLLPINTPDPRWPARIGLFPSASDISYIDIHFYPMNTSWTAGAELSSMEWSTLDKTRKPFYATEFGAFKSFWPNVAAAATMLRDVRNDLYNTYGFSGECLYTFDTTGDPNYWATTEGGGVVNSLLAPCVRWRNYEFDGNILEGWTTNNMSNSSVGGGNFSATLTGNPAYLASSPSLSIDTKFVRKVAVNLRNASNADGLDLYWTTSTDLAWNEAKAVHKVQTPNSGKYVEHIFDLWNIPTWNGTVTQLIVVPGRLQGNGLLSGTTYIDYIHAMDWSASESTLNVSPTNNPPTVAIINPANNTNVQKQDAVIINATASDDVGVVGVVFYIDGKAVNTDTIAPYSLTLDTSDYAAGSHTIAAQAWDVGGPSQTASLTVNIAEAIPVNNPPAISISSPTSSAKIQKPDSVTVCAIASDDVGVVGVMFYIDGKSANTDTTEPYSWIWNTTDYAAGSHTIEARAWDSGNLNRTVSVTVSLTEMIAPSDQGAVSDSSPPSVSPQPNNTAQNVSSASSVPQSINILPSTDSTQSSLTPLSPDTPTSSVDSISPGIAPYPIAGPVDVSTLGPTAATFVAGIQPVLENSQVTTILTQLLNATQGQELIGAMASFASSVHSNESRTFVDSASGSIVMVSNIGGELENQQRITIDDAIFPISFDGVPAGHTLVAALLPLSKESHVPKGAIGKLMSFSLKRDGGFLVTRGFDIKLGMLKVGKESLSYKLFVQKPNGDFEDSGFPVAHQGGNLQTSLTHFSVYALVEDEVPFVANTLSSGEKTETRTNDLNPSGGGCFVSL